LSATAMGLIFKVLLPGSETRPVCCMSSCRWSSLRRRYEEYRKRVWSSSIRAERRGSRYFSPPEARTVLTTTLMRFLAHPIFDKAGLNKTAANTMDNKRTLTVRVFISVTPWSEVFPLYGKSKMIFYESDK